MSLSLGIDTSNYTTSLACFDSSSDVMHSFSRLLPVKSGQLGLRQSDALFHHTKALPEMFSALEERVDLSGADSVGVSVSPRSEQGSYMPCFLAGINAACAFAAGKKIVPHRFSHQQGHIAAALFSENRLDLLKTSFLAFHLSGGTTEAVIVSPDRERIISTKIVASSLDLKAGQAIDRVGVMLGLDFPAGKAMDALSCTCSEKYKIRPSMKGSDCSLSGVENKCRKMLEEGREKNEIALFCLEMIASAVESMLSSLIKEYGDLPVVFSGGVSSNSLLRKRITSRFDAVFARPEYACDNAAGIAVLTSIAENGI